METQGKVSEWNEATLKIIRLHEIQGTINLLKMDPLGRSDGKFNYVWLINNVDALYGEGYSKYTTKERAEVDKIRKLTFDCLKYMPPHKNTKTEGFNVARSAYLLNKYNYDMLMELIEMFVRKVKDLNDDHGLTTKNKGTGGLF
jgi:hypothetical protein